MSYVDLDGVRFHYRTAGDEDGVPVFLQHGLGGDVAQPFGLVEPPPGVRLLAFDCRGHGETRPPGEAATLGFAPFADDLIAVMDHLAIERAVIGGISMGAGIALNAALRYPGRVQGLILARPAWLDGPMPEWAREAYAAIAGLIRRYGARRGRDAFRRGALYRDVARLEPATAASLLGQFDRAQAEDGVAVLERLPRDAPLHDLAALAALARPALVLANQRDPIHPYAFGEAVARAIPGARLDEVTSKAIDAGRHARDVRTAIDAFLSSSDLVAPGGPP